MTSFSKLGPYTIGGSQSAKDMIDAGCRVILMTDGFGLAAHARAKGTPYIIGRRIITYPNDPQRVITAESQRHKDPRDAAEEYVSVITPTLDANPDINIWCGWNEPVWNDAAGMAWYAEAEAWRIKLLADRGETACFGNFATGNPGDLSLWPAFMPAFTAARQYGAICGLHEYGGTWMWWMTGQYQINPDEDAGDYGWTTKRFLRPYNALQVTDVPLIITECGLDAVHPPRPGFNTGHWRFCTGEWARWDGHDDPIDYWRNGGRDNEVYYAEQLKWYDRELQKYPYVKGAVVFTAGHGATGWGDFEIDGTRVASELVKHIQSTITEPDDDPPDDEEPPMTAINFSDLDYSKTYHVRNDIYLPVGMKFKNAPPGLRISWKDIKPGSPTFGQVKTMDQDFAEDEVQEKLQAEMPDIPYPLGKTIAIKDFLGFKPRWSLIYFSFKTVVGTKYLLKWKVRPELISDYAPDNSKIYAPDPASGWLRIRVRSGEVEMEIDGLNPDEAAPDRAWKNGRDFPFGKITEFQAVIDALDTAVTVGLETLGPHGLKDNNFTSWLPDISVISTPTDPNTGDDEPPISGTVREKVVRILAMADKLEDGVAAARELDVLMG